MTHKGLRVIKTQRNQSSLSDHCPATPLQTIEVWLCQWQVSLAWSFALCTQELYMQPHVLKEKWREGRTGSSSLNFQAVFTCVVVESSRPLTAESMSPR